MSVEEEINSIMKENIHRLTTEMIMDLVNAICDEMIEPICINHKLSYEDLEVTLMQVKRKMRERLDGDKLSAS